MTSTDQPTAANTFVVVPTYNERGTIESLLCQLFAVADLSVVVVDDDSPDGTWELVERLQTSYPHLHLIRRQGVRGRGTAGVEGFRYALEQDARYILEMDADLSHQPRHVPEFLSTIRSCDVVLGSRFVLGGRQTKRSLTRRFITRCASLLIQRVLKIPIRDCTSGYRCFQRHVLEGINLDSLLSRGPAIVQEILYKASLKGYRIQEIPIEFVERTEGQSTFNWRVLLDVLIMVFILKYLFSDFRQRVGMMPTIRRGRTTEAHAEPTVSSVHTAAVSTVNAEHEPQAL